MLLLKVENGAVLKPGKFSDGNTVGDNRTTLVFWFWLWKIFAYRLLTKKDY